MTSECNEPEELFFMFLGMAGILKERGKLKLDMLVTHSQDNIHVVLSHSCIHVFPLKICLWYNTDTNLHNTVSSHC